MTILRLSPGPTLRVKRNIEFSLGRDFRLPYTAELLAGDFAQGIGIAQVILTIAADFGQTPLLSKTITTTQTSSGKITDDATTDGVGAFYFTLTSTEMHQFSSPVAFEVIVIDTLGRSGSFDFGALAPDVSMAGSPVDHIVVAPANASVLVGASQQFTATLYDVTGNVLIGRVVAWSSSNPAVATVDPVTGLAVGVGNGSATITATAEGKTSSGVLASAPATFQQMLAAVNALGGGTQGMTVSVAYLFGLGPTYQTITADVASSTGFYCSKIENALNPGDGNHLRPVATLHSGKGAECTVDGKIVSDGLWCPGTAPFLAAPGWQDDPTLISAIANTVPNALFADRGKGFSIHAIAGIRIGTATWRLGPTGGANTFRLDNLSNPGAEPLRDPLANFGAPLTAGQGSTPTIIATHFRHMADAAFVSPGGVTGGNFRYERYSRDIIQDGGSGIAGNVYAAGRELVINDNNGIAAAADTPFYGLLLGPGEMNAQQTAQFHNWTEAQPWGAGFWKDTRSLGFLFGDSEQEPLHLTMQADGMDHSGHIVRGFKGRPRIPNFTLVALARAGNTPATYQYPFKRWLENCDFTRRPKLVSMQWEMLNGGTVANNYAWADEMRTFLGAKGKLVGYDTTYDTDTNKAFNEPGVYNELVAHAVPAHYDFLIHLHDGMHYSAFNGGDWTTDPLTGPRAEWWVTRHPKDPDTQEYLTAFYAAGFELALGIDLSARAMKVDPQADHAGITVGGGTYQILPTRIRYDGIALAGGSYSYTSRLPAKATVGASSGVVTAVANGDVAIDVWSSDGAKGTEILQVTGGGATVQLNATFTAADTANGVPNADTGQVAYRDGTGLWGVSSNQLYHSGDSGVDDQGTGYSISGLSGAYTATIDAPVLKWNMGLEFRRQDANNKFRARYDASSGNESVHVEKRIAGAAWAAVGSVMPIVMQNGDTFRVVGSTTSPAFTVDIVRGGSVVATGSFSDSALQSANGFGANELQVLVTSRWDNLKVTQP